MTGKTIARPLTDAERTLVERYHNLIYRVMHDLHLGTEADTDLYGEAALGLILAAQRYLTDESLQKYRFTMIAYSRIRNALLRQRCRERRQPQVLSLDAWQADGGTLYDVLPDECSTDPADIVIRRDRAALQKGRAVRSCKLYRFPVCAAPRKGGGIRWAYTPTYMWSITCTDRGTLLWRITA